MTLPRGPTESTQSWYASARLGVYVLTTILWGQGAAAGPTIHYFIGRCKEKSAPYSLAAWEFCLEKLLDLSGVSDLMWWSDGGRHFRAACPISTMSARGVEMLCRHSDVTDHCHTVDLAYGVPSHFKNQCDGAQASLKGLLAEVCKKRKVSTIEDMVQLCRMKYEEYAKDPKRKTRYPAVFHHFSSGDQSCLRREVLHPVLAEVVHHAHHGLECLAVSFERQEKEKPAVLHSGRCFHRPRI